MLVRYTRHTIITAHMNLYFCVFTQVSAYLHIQQVHNTVCQIDR